MIGRLQEGALIVGGGIAALIAAVVLLVVMVVAMLLAAMCRAEFWLGVVVIAVLSRMAGWW